MPKKTQRVDQRIFDSFGGTRIVDGETIETYLSPFNAPRSLSYARDEDSNILRIEFAYIDDEKSIENCKHGSAEIEIGKYSRRILSIALTLENNSSVEDAAQIAAELVRVIDEHQDHVNTPTMNMDAAKAAIEGASDRLFETTGG